MGTLIVAGNDLTAGLLNQYYGMADTTTTTVTAAATTTLSTAYTVPSGEPVVGSTYRLSCGGYGQEGSTSQQLTWIFYFGSAVGSSPTIGSNNWANLATFRYFAWFEITCTSTGAGATWWGSMGGCMTQTNNNVIVGTAANNTVPFADANATAHTAATTGSITAQIQVAWGSVTGGPTITNQYTTFRKIA